MAEKKKHNHSFILGFFLVVLCASFVISLITIHKQISDTKQEIATVDSANEEQKAENAKLRKSIDSGEIDEYVEEIARDKLGYVMPGERVYYDVSAND